MNNKDPFFKYLGSLKREDTGILAALRRASGQRLAESRECQWFASVSRRPEDFLTATLVAQYPAAQIREGRHQGSYQYRGSIGAAWAAYCRKRDPEQDPAAFYRRRQEAMAAGLDPPRPPSIHERFRTLLDAQLDADGTGELAYRLRGLVRMLVAEDIPIDAIQLASDMRGWRAESRYVQERWAMAFYGQSSVDKSDDQDVGEVDETETPEIQGQEDENAD